MSFTVTFDGIDLTKYLIVSEGFNRNIGTNRANDSIQIGKSNFRKYKGYSLDQKVIEMPFILRYDLISKRRELAKILNVSEPTPLVFSDEPDKYYMAITSEDISVDELVFLGKGTITWEIPDGVAHSLSESSESAVNGNLSVNNKGTYKTYPILTAKMNSDNGLVAFINQNGALLQFGNPDEVDSVPYEESDWVIRDTNLTQSNVEKAGWKVNDVKMTDTFMGAYKLENKGTVQYKAYNGKNIVSVNSWGTGTNYHGISLSRNISADSQGHVGAKNFSTRIAVLLTNTAVNQTGMNRIELRDVDGDAVAAITFYKTETTNNNIKIRLNVGATAFHEYTFQSNVKNIYTLMQEFMITKNEGTFNFHCGGVAAGGFVKTYRDDSKATTEVTQVVWYAGVFGSNAVAMDNGLVSVTFQKHNVDKFRNIPNTFGGGDVLRIDVEKCQVFLNGLERHDLGALGNDFEQFALETGDNTIMCLNSNWASNVEFAATWREAFL